VGTALLAAIIGCGTATLLALGLKEWDRTVEGSWSA